MGRNGRERKMRRKKRQRNMAQKNARIVGAHSMAVSKSATRILLTRKKINNTQRKGWDFFYNKNLKT